MIITDEIYGKFLIEPVLSDLLQSDALVRLKGIHHGGASYLANAELTMTVYEHSVGVMLLVRLFGGGIEEQIAGLLHEVCYPALSYGLSPEMIVEEKKTFEQIQRKWIILTTIPQILEKYDYNLEEILFEKGRWQYINEELPNISVDRIDHALRESFHYMSTPKSEIKEFVREVELIRDKLIIRSVPWAEWFVDKYFRVTLDFRYQPVSGYCRALMVKVIERALDINEIRGSHFTLTDDKFLEKLHSSQDIVIIQSLREFQNLPQLSDNSKKPGSYPKEKLPIIDPLIFHEGTVFLSSLVSSRIARIIDMVEKRNVVKVFD